VLPTESETAISIKANAMKVSRLGKEDIDAVIHIVANLIDSSHRKSELPKMSHLENLLHDDRTYLLAAFMDNLVVGDLLAYRFPSLYAPEFLAYLYDIEVLPIHRRKDVGRLLVETILTHLAPDGVTELWLGTAVDNTEAQALFASTGAVRSGETFYDYTYYLT
jgi:ribosomal protein S18 acetylase RimI-like enzyme